MSLKRRAATEVADSGNNGSDGPNLVYDNLPLGEHEGRLVFIVDLGLQAKEYAGEFKGNFQQIALGIEAVDSPIYDEEGTAHPRFLWTRPFYIYDNMDEKSVEYEFYTVFEPSAKPGDDPEWEKQLGKPVNMFIEHNKDKKDPNKKYDNIKSLSAIPAKYQDNVAPNKIEPGIGDADDENNPVNKKLFGLAKYVFGKRIIGTQSAPQEQAPSDIEDFDDDTPY